MESLGLASGLIAQARGTSKMALLGFSRRAQRPSALFAGLLSTPTTSSPYPSSSPLFLPLICRWIEAVSRGRWPKTAE